MHSKAIQQTSHPYGYKPSVQVVLQLGFTSAKDLIVTRPVCRMKTFQVQCPMDASRITATSAKDWPFKKVIGWYFVNRKILKPDDSTHAFQDASHGAYQATATVDCCRYSGKP